VDSNDAKWQGLVLMHENRKSKVAIVKGEDRKENIKKALTLLKEDIKKRVSGNVLVKPNLVSPIHQNASTHVDALRGLLEFIRDNCSNCAVVIGEGTPRAQIGYKSFGYYSIANEFETRLLDLSRSAKFVEIALENTAGKTVSAKLIETAIKSNCRISVALPKIHDIVPVTLSLKNMIGFLKKDDMVKMHGIEIGVSTKFALKIARLIGEVSPQAFELLRRLYYKLRYSNSNVYKNKLCLPHSSVETDSNLIKNLKALTNNLVTLAKYIAPHISVIDGYVGMEGSGPIHGTVVDLKLAVVSTDFLAADAVCTQIMGIDPMEVGYINKLNRESFGTGDLNRIQIVGEKLESVTRYFKRYPNYPKSN
jgi:uncharacterized protein (DUF362 family)